MRCISWAITVNRDVTNSWNSLLILNDTPTKVNLDQSYFRASILAVQHGSWSCWEMLVKTGRPTTSPPPSVPILLPCYHWTNKHVVQLEMMHGSHYGQDWLSWGSDSKSGRRLIRICHVPIRHFCPIHHESCAFLITATRMTTRIKEMNVRGNNGESGRNKFKEQRPNLE